MFVGDPSSARQEANARVLTRRLPREEIVGLTSRDIRGSRIHLDDGAAGEPYCALARPKRRIFWRVGDTRVGVQRAVRTGLTSDIDGMIPINMTSPCDITTSCVLSKT